MSQREALALCTAARTGDTATVKACLRAGVPVDIRVPKSMRKELEAARKTSLMLAADQGRLPIVKLLLSHGADPNLKDEYNCTALAVAVDKKQLPIVKRLLAAGADPNQRIFRGDFVLRTAATGRMPIEMTKLLLSYGADVHAQYDGSTALHIASYHDRVDVAKLLVKAGANLNGPRDWIGTPLCAAIAHGRPRMIEFLLQQGIDPQQQPDALGMAAWDGQLKTVRRLLEAGFDPNSKSFRGRTPLSQARSHKHAKIVETLLASGAK